MKFYKRDSDSNDYCDKNCGIKIAIAETLYGDAYDSDNNRIDRAITVFSDLLQILINKNILKSSDLEGLLNYDYKVEEDH